MLFLISQRTASNFLHTPGRSMSVRNLYKVPFSSGIVAGWDDVSSWASDEYGRKRSDPDYQNKKQSSEEWLTTRKAKLAWAVKREGKSFSRSHHQFNDAEDRIMRGELAKYHEQTVKPRQAQPLVALRPTKISASDPPSSWWPGER